ncbi:response regulator transcription factor [Paenibacillus sp. Leaf72]|uniref:response regulator transcription factor n=1 Tax=Paenibacillus sp. Leaf72 TaxID=1736234 RepID=UPI0006FDF5A7|nr:response regulator [Paenibacillus sp. Leaf72]KQO16572.1 AraC family transcriptional regulator [Paenibacillus sp. Leaf72]
MYKLLIADDEIEIRNGLSQYIPWDHIGFEVVGQAANGLHALEYMAEKPVDVLLCDIKMPQMGGIEVARKLFEQRSSVSVVLLSGHREFELAQQALNYGVKQYLLKPTKYSEINKVFERLKEDLDLKALLEQQSEPSDDAQTEEQPAPETAIDKIKHYISCHYKEASLENASNVVYMNPYYLSKYFKQKTGENFSDYLTAVRMNKAAELLKDPSYKTYEISELVGYSNAKNFTRTFRRYFGETPREYRNMDGRRLE